jgi:hypothetical protein
MPCSDSLVGLFSFFLLCFAIASVQVGNAIKEPCQSINIKRTDTNEDVTSEVVLLDDITETPKSFSCGGEGWVWAPTARTDYIGFMSELSDIGTYAFNRIDSLIHTNLMFQSNGGHKEGFYYCTNAINFGCFVGVFQRTNLMPNNVRVNHITHTGFEVYWSKVAHTDYIRGYNLTVISEGKSVFKETVPPSGATEYNRKISCLTPGKQYIVQIDALYSFQPASEGYFKVSDEVQLSTPNGAMSETCIEELEAPNVEVKAHPLSRSSVSITWTTPTNIKPTKSIIRYRNVLSSDTLEKVVEGSSTSVEINNLEMGATYMFSVAVHAASTSLMNISRSVSKFSENVYITIHNNITSDLLSHKANVLNSSSVRLFWNVSNYLYYNCVPTVHQINYTLLSETNQESPVDSITVHHPASGHIISNLRPYGKYRFQVRTVCDDGVHSHTSETVLRTNATAPTGRPKVSNLTVCATVAVFNIKSPSSEKSNGAINLYILEYSQLEGNSSAAVVQIASSCSDRTFYVLDHLATGVTYNYRLSASNEAGSGPFTEWKTFQTVTPCS